MLTAARDESRALTVKFGIDPTAADVHVGHTVPMILAARFQRMGHRVVFIVGDVTARIGDPSGRSGERPPLTDEDVRAQSSHVPRPGLAVLRLRSRATSGSTANGSGR